ncbi:MAG: helix-turn-helix transcriptional regulator [Bacteroidales bacterium]|jgi:transcriptional regulator with XRE-family HTH domain|nr:helix-turn-helix transcriptional regulator [Bacteroidales bacterium]
MFKLAIKTLGTGNGEYYTQSELGKQAGTSGDLIGRYERDEVKPSIEVIMRIADALSVSIDYLVGKTDLEIDQDTLRRLRDVSKLPADAKKQIFLVVDALIRDFKAKQAYSA